MKFEKKVIDAHYHIYDPINEFGTSVLDGVQNYIEGIGFHSININGLPFSSEEASRDVSNNILTALCKLKHPHIFAHGGICYDEIPVPPVMTQGMDPLTQYRELMEIGFDGIKLLETKPSEIRMLRREICSDLYEPMFAAAEADGTHFVWHVADPEYFWDIEKMPKAYVQMYLDRGWYYGGGDSPSFREVINQAMTVVQRHPKLNVTFAHFLCLSEYPQELEEIFAKYPNVNIDLTPGVNMYNSFGKAYDFYRDFFIRYADRLEYGTDSSNTGHVNGNFNYRSDLVYRFLTTTDDFDEWTFKFKGFALDDATLDKILWANFERRVSVTPKPINVEALKRYIAKYGHLIKSEETRKFIDEIMAQY